MALIRGSSFSTVLWSVGVCVRVVLSVCFEAVLRFQGLCLTAMKKGLLCGGRACEELLEGGGLQVSASHVTKGGGGVPD